MIASTKGNFFYFNLKEQGHPYYVRWFAAFDDKLNDDVINIIANYTFGDTNSTSNPKTNLLEEARLLGLFTKHSIIPRNINSLDPSNDHLMVLGASKKYDEITKLTYQSWDVKTHFKRLKKYSIPFLTKIMNADLNTRFEWCIDVFSIRDKVMKYSTLKLQLFKAPFVAWVYTLTQHIIGRKIILLSTALKVGYLKHFEPNNKCAFRKEWDTLEAMKSKGYTCCDELTFAGAPTTTQAQLKMVYPKYIQSTFIFTKPQLINAIQNKINLDIITTPVRGISGQIVRLEGLKVRFLRWYMMTEGAYMDDYYALRLAIVRCDVEEMAKYPKLTHLFS